VFILYEDYKYREKCIESTVHMRAYILLQWAFVLFTLILLVLRIIYIKIHGDMFYREGTQTTIMIEKAFGSNTEITVPLITD
jgi:hypothetical protein